MNNAVIAGGTAPNVTSRIVALVSASVFDAVNGIKPRFRPLRARPDAPVRDLRELLLGLDQVAFASAHGVEVAPLAARARALARELSKNGGPR